MFRSYVNLRDRYALPVLTIAIFLQVGLDGIDVDVYEEHFWELRPVHFEYLYVGLPALDAIEYLEGDNWLGVALAALMKIPRERIAWLGAEALRRLREAPLNDQKRFLLGECVEAYLPLDDTGKREFERLLSSEPYQGVKAVNVTTFEKGVTQGVQQGILQGKREVLREQLDDKFGPLPNRVTERLQSLSEERVHALTRAILRALSLQELGLEDE
jgi:hypothetical protein